ncbi:group II intron reverse transcriptase/maturase, partial [Thiolapillus sp.]|uniref:group II intron reverse transcriptase/maturase n=3 Tax=Thiolapillus sp. TaxID=2017437 RepID=UPI003AF42F4B
MITWNPTSIPKRLIVEAYKRVKANKGSAGVDEQTLEMFEQNLKGNLYKLWNRMSSGSYFPQAVKRVEIPEADGGIRPLGIPTVSDRIAQMAVKLQIEGELEQHFHPDSYGYRPNKSAHQAVAQVKARCWKRAWVLDMDIKGFFDAIDHALLMRAVEKHVKEDWQRLYIKRWLRASVQHKDGHIEAREQGTPQGGVISPLLANLFLHYAFDHWVERHWKGVQFERYADDIVCHCKTEQEAIALQSTLNKRFSECGLTLHRCQPWRAKRRLVDPSSREAALFSRRALRQRENKVGLRTRR